MAKQPTNAFEPFDPRVALAVLGVAALSQFVLGVARAQSNPANFATVINAPPTILGSNESIGSDTQLNIWDDPSVDYEVGYNFDAGSSDGTSQNVEVNLYGGALALDFHANAGSTVNIWGGSTDRFLARQGSVVRMFGGELGEWSYASSGSAMLISGGTIGRFFQVDKGSSVTYVGGEFLVNGEAVSDPVSVSLAAGEVLSGTLFDGTVFALAPWFPYLDFGEIRLTSVPLPQVDLTPFLVDEQTDVPPRGLRSGQSLTLRDQGLLPANFAAVGATLNIEGGSVGESLEVVDSDVTITGGTFGDTFSAYSGSTVDIGGGELGWINAFDGAEVNLHGGTFLGVVIRDGGVVHQSGGALIGANYDLRSGATINVSGGEFDLSPFQHFLADPGSAVNFTVLEASLNESPLNEALIPGLPLTIGVRDPQEFLNGTLADGSVLRFELIDANNAYFAPSRNEIHPDATVTVSLATDSIPGDFNGDGIVDAADYVRLREDLAAAAIALDAAGLSDSYAALAQAGYDLLQQNFGAVAPAENAVPEPTAILLVGLGFSAWALFPRRRV